jgi:hypothetical protein
VQAIDVVVEAAEAASKNDSAFDLFATAAADVRATGRLNPNPKPRAVLGPDVLFLLAELLDRTSSAVANWVTHQPTAVAGVADGDAPMRFTLRRLPSGRRDGTRRAHV